MKSARFPTVVLGIGNVLMKDDGVGVWIVRSLAERYRFPSGVRLVEGGVAGIGLLPVLAEASSALIVDALDRGDPPGTLYRLDGGELSTAGGARLSAHEIGIPELLATAEAMGCHLRTRIVGIQPSDCRNRGESLTPSVKRALPGAREAVLEELRAIGVVPKAKRSAGKDGIEYLGKGGKEHA